MGLMALPKSDVELVSPGAQAPLLSESLDISMSEVSNGTDTPVRLCKYKHTHYIAQAGGWLGLCCIRQGSCTL